MTSGRKKQNKKLLLVSANTHTSPYPVYPLGVSYLKTYLDEKTEGMDIRIFDFMNHTMDDYVEMLGTFNPDYAGISLRNIDDVNIYRQESFISHYQQIVSVTRKKSHAVIITGGSGFSIYPVVLYDMLEPDFGIYGEGEESLEQLIRALREAKGYQHIPGLIYRDNGNTTVNPRIHRLETPSLSFDTGLVDFYWTTSGMLNIQTKRGCPYHCIYCTYPLIEGNRIRTLNVRQVIETLSDLYHTRKIDYVFFTDSVFNSENEYNMELADLLISENIRIKWGGYFNFTNISRSLLAKLKEAGLAHIEFGTESLSEKMLRNYGKPFTVKDILQACEICNDLEIHFAHFLILGGFGETNGTLEETFENAKKIRRSVFFPFIGMRIYPGTRLHKIALREKIVNEDQSLLKPVYYVSKQIDIDDIKVRAKATGQTWIFPDDDLSAGMEHMRKKGKKGPLWEYLIK